MYLYQFQRNGRRGHSLVSTHSTNLQPAGRSCSSLPPTDDQVFCLHCTSFHSTSMITSSIRLQQSPRFERVHILSEAFRSQTITCRSSVGRERRVVNSYRTVSAVFGTGMNTQITHLDAKRGHSLLTLLSLEKSSKLRDPERVSTAVALS